MGKVEEMGLVVRECADEFGDVRGVQLVATRDGIGYFIGKATEYVVEFLEHVCGVPLEVGWKPAAHRYYFFPSQRAEFRFGPHSRDPE